jgi:hypothetical protein
MLKTTFSTGGTRRWLGLSLALAAVLAVAPPTPAHAAAVEFAKFAFTSGTDFNFTNNTSSATLGNGTNTVSFSFTDPSGNATLTATASVAFTGSTTTPAGTLGSTVVQPINTASTIKFTDVDPGVNFGKTLLAVTYTGDLIGQNGTPNISLQSSSNINTLVYSSDPTFLPSSFFSNPQNFILNLPTDGSSPIGIGAGGFLNSFVASNAQGQFFTTVVPAPTSVVMLGCGIAAAALLGVRQARKIRPGLVQLA